jgi:hypothetical protein
MSILDKIDNYLEVNEELAKDPRKAILSSDQMWVAGKPSSVKNPKGTYTYHDVFSTFGNKSFEKAYKEGQSVYKDKNFSMWIAKQTAGKKGGVKYELQFEYPWDMIKDLYKKESVEESKTPTGLSSSAMRSEYKRLTGKEMPTGLSKKAMRNMLDKVKKVDESDEHKGVFSKKYGLNLAPALPPPTKCKKCGKTKRFYATGPASDKGMCPACAHEIEKKKFYEIWRKQRMKEIELEDKK